MNDATVDTRNLRTEHEQEAAELREKQAQEARELREKRNAEIREAKEARVAELRKTVPKPGEGGHYSPPVDPSVVRSPQGFEVSPNEPPPGMSPEEQPALIEAQLRTEAEQAALEGKAPPSGSTSEESVDYNDMTVAELKDEAHRRGIAVHSDMLKDDLVKALKKADKAS